MNKYHQIVHNYAKVKVLVVGDPMMDIYHFGRAERISPEAPVPVFIEESQKGRPGGAANVAANLEALGCQVRSAFPVGGQTTQKHRYMVGHHQLFRIDRDVIRKPTPADIENAVSLTDWADVVVLSDYAKGWLTPEMCRAVIHSAETVVVDPKGNDWSKYYGAAVICPNEREMQAVCGDGVFRWNSWLVEKKGEKGLVLYDDFGTCHESSPAQARQVFDVTGAGDTVVAAIAATLGLGRSLSEALRIANCAAGVVVGKIGTAECSAQELLCALDSATAASTDCTLGIDSFSSEPDSTVTGSLSPLTLTSPCGL